MKTVIIIPARYKSTRFPGKPLVKIMGTEAILLTYRAARNVRHVDAVYIATDSNEIKKVAEANGATVLMTSEKCRNGTERVAEAARKIGAKRGDLIINFQGDAPLTPAWFVEAIIKKLKNIKDADMVTPVLRCDEDSYLRFTNDRKNGRVGATTAVFDQKQRALYFSKEVIPFLSSAKELTSTPVYHHVGIYGYRMDALQAYPKWDVGPLEKAEQLEQLRFLENGKKVYVTEVKDKGVQFWELNNPQDVAIIEGMMRSNAELVAKKRRAAPSP
jgi:3-deoxy-manno-octulosonate cytidylyltransferase (CMP-KDO synthetase)